MKSKKSEGFNTPFEALRGLVDDKDRKKKPAPPPPAPPKAPPPPPPKLEPEREDELLFAMWTTDVRPLSGAPKTEPRKPGPITPREEAPEDPEAEALAQLAELIGGGSGFVVSHTGEYIEGAGYGAPPDTPARLHAGEFSIQAHIDLHGMLAEEAEEALDAFLKDAIAAGRRAVLLVHGRGRSSRNEPVLKNRVLYRLTRGVWRKWVIAFASARSVDGGAGATYVLLRTRPVTHKSKKS